MHCLTNGQLVEYARFGYFHVGFFLIHLQLASMIPLVIGGL
jgi:hypothetical protein